LADERKRNAILTERATMMQDELNKVAIHLRDSELKRLDSEKKAQVLAASSRSRPGATISANNSARGSLRPIEIPGLEVRQDGDVIRVALPADQLFAPGTDQMLPSAGMTLADAARAITQSYPRQLMGIEAFTDGAANGPMTPHQLTASQALVVLNELTQRYRMPANQLMIVGHGANTPRGSSGSFADRARSRRVEIVIYPETVN
jgi:outer membrane protein OmpA-like peptidoglycan-associated protein